MRRLALLVLAVFLSGCVSEAAITQARTEQAVNQGHSSDSQLAPEARLIAQDNWDAWSAQLFNLTGAKLPTEVAARLAERGALPEGYEAGE